MGVMIMDSGVIKVFYSLFFFIIDLFILCTTFYRRKGSRAQFTFCCFSAAVVLLQLTALNILSFENGLFNCAGPIRAFSFLMVVVLPVVGTYFFSIWLIRFFSLHTKTPTFAGRFLSALPMVIYFVMCFASFKTHWIFYVDESWEYHRGSLYFLQPLVPYSYLVVVTVLLFYKKIVEKKQSNVKALKLILFYVVPPAIGSYIQIFLDKHGFYSEIGISVGLLLVYIGTYLSDAEEHRRLKDLADFNESLQLVNKQLRSTMMRGEMQAKTVAETIRGGFKIGKCDRNFTFKYVSEQLAQMMGYSVAEMMDPSFGNMGAFVDKDEVKRQLPTAMALASEGKMFTMNYKVRCKDGSWKHVEERGRVIQSEGAEDEVWSVIIDKDEIVQTEIALTNAENSRKRLAEYTDIIANAGMGVWFISLKDGTRPRMRANKKMREIMGVPESVTSEEDVYDFWFNRIPESELSSVNNSVMEMRSGKFSENTYRWNHPARGTVYVRCGGTAQKVVDGIYVLSGYHYDVTEIVNKEMTQQTLLKNALTMAEKSSRAKTAFLNNMSHDIRTPMNAILGFATLMSKDLNNPEKLKDYLTKLKSSGDYLLSLINNVLEMASIESGKSELEETPTCLSGNTADTMGIFEAGVKEHNLTISSKMDIQHNYVYVDMVKIREILINLISNAIKYSKPGGHIYTSMTEVPCAREGYAAYDFVVEDDGIGMSEEFLPQIFESFVRERNSTESKISGSGLGLPIVKKLVELMGGNITVESTLGKGSKFTVYLEHRICSKEDVVGKDEENVQNPKDVAGRRILLVEDNDLNAEIAMTLLQDRGLLVERAEDGCVCLEMLEKADAGYYDVVLMDIQMPRKDGYDTAQEIRQMKNDSLKNVPIVAMTANAFEEDKRKALAAGMNAHVAKPIDVEVLIKTLTSIIK